MFDKVSSLNQILQCYCHAVKTKATMPPLISAGIKCSWKEENWMKKRWNSWKKLQIAHYTLCDYDIETADEHNLIGYIVVQHSAKEIEQGCCCAST